MERRLRFPMRSRQLVEISRLTVLLTSTLLLRLGLFKSVDFRPRNDEGVSADPSLVSCLSMLGRGDCPDECWSWSPIMKASHGRSGSSTSSRSCQARVLDKCWKMESSTDCADEVRQRCCGRVIQRPHLAPFGSRSRIPPFTAHDVTRW